MVLSREEILLELAELNQRQTLLLHWLQVLESADSPPLAAFAPDPADEVDMVWGVAAAAKVVNISTRVLWRLIEKGKFPESRRRSNQANAAHGWPRHVLEKYELPPE